MMMSTYIFYVSTPDILFPAFGSECEIHLHQEEVCSHGTWAAINCVELTSAPPVAGAPVAGDVEMWGRRG